MRALRAVALIAALLASTAPQAADGTGFEILQFTRNGIITWLNLEMTEEQFDAIELPRGWTKNQPRETDVDVGRFFSSPGLPEGEFVDEVLFGYEWRHVATIVGYAEDLDEDGLLMASRVSKHHEITFLAGRTLTLLISPTGDIYPRVTRDLNRPTDTPTIPTGWRLTEYTIANDQVIALPTETEVIRADNEDSFQGPVWCFRPACRATSP
ncbi:MAG: hypothetical protein AAFX85_18460 [Pseudomonadota bacterium]